MADTSANEYSKVEQDLLKEGENAPQWAASIEAKIMAVAIAAIFIFAQFQLINSLGKDAQYVLCVRSPGQPLMILDISLIKVLKGAAVLIGFAISTMFLLLIRLWQERILFTGIIKRLRGDASATKPVAAAVPVTASQASEPQPKTNP